MRSNPGGQLSPDQIVGRDELIERMWGVLEGRSIYMSDLRRIGKTQIMVKMHASPRPGWTTVKCDLGGVHTAAEFATQAYRMSTEALASKAKAGRRMEDLLGKLRGVEIAGFIKLANGSAAPWKEVLRRTFADIDEAMISLGAKQRVLFLWDEVPFLLDNISRRESPAVAMEVLDSLRSLGQDHDRIRLLLTGSIGLHHILRALQAGGYNNSPLNRMELIQPGPLSNQDSRDLARRLLVGDGIEYDDVDATALAIAELTGNVSFYIHKLISRIPKSEKATPESVRLLLRSEITSDNSDWDLQHYRDRLKPYYGDDEKVVLRILDAAAIGKPLSFHDVRRDVAVGVDVDEEHLRELLGLLCRDHYLVRNPDNHYVFYLDLIRHWWCLNRSLQAQP